MSFLTFDKKTVFLSFSSMRRLIPIWFLLFCSMQMPGQEEDAPEIITAKFPLVSLRLNAGIPNPSSNEVFRRKFVGIYETNLAVNFRIAKTFFIGIGFKNGLLTVTDHIQYGVNTKMQMNAAYVKAGWNYFHTNKVFSTFYLNTGYNKSMFTSVISSGKPLPDPHVSSFIIEPGYSINFFAEDNMTLGFYTSFNYMPRKFDPAQVNFAYVTSLSGLSTSQNTTYINIGLEMYWGFPKRKK
jgi:hypothetical protein